MVDKREKTISYRRAEWIVGDGSLSLEGALKEVCQKLATVADRTFVRPSGQHIRLVKFQPGVGGDGVYVHITADTPGESASVVPRAQQTSVEISISTAPPPPNSEFMDGDAFLYIQEDHVCLCMTVLRDGAVSTFLQELIDKSKIRKARNGFILAKVANINKIKIIRSQGVKEIELKATMYEASASYQRRSKQMASVVGVASRHVRALFGKEYDVTNDGLRIAINIKADRRFTNHMQVGEKRISEIAERLVSEHEHDDDFTIITRLGQRISPDEIYVCSKVEIDKKGKSIDQGKAWDELRKFYETLQASGALEQ